MSSHTIVNKLNRTVKWGLDLPTGGFFYNEFFTDEELKSKHDGDELASFAQGLTLSQLHKDMLEKFEYQVRLDFVAFDLKNAQQPTHLQFNVSKMFGVNLADKLQALDDDLQQNWN